eukprot:1155915-Pelagomonas_calceolata.AAC.1
MQLHQVALQPLNAAPTCLRAASRPSLPARTRPACRHSSVASLKQKVVGSVTCLSECGTRSAPTAGGCEFGTYTASA